MFLDESCNKGEEPCVGTPWVPNRKFTSTRSLEGTIFNETLAGGGAVLRLPVRVLGMIRAGAGTR